MLLRSSKKRSASRMSSEPTVFLTLITTTGERSSPCTKKRKAAPQQKARPQPHPWPKSSLLTLPYEIRNQIFHGVLTNPASCRRWPHGTEDKVVREVAPWIGSGKERKQ